MAFGSESEESDPLTSLTSAAATSGYCLLRPPPSLEKQHACIYEGCSAKFSRPYRLQAHVSAKHSGEKPFACYVNGCDKAYASKMHLKRHMSSHVQSSTAEDILFPCSFEGCSAVFKFKQNERRHFKRSHILKTCSDCGKTFKKTSQLRRHTSEHTGTPTICCDLCTERFFTKSDLKRHISRSHRLHFCSVKGCYEAFETWSLVRKHMRLHPRDLQCYHCDKKFRLRKALLMHVQKHLESPFGVIKRKPPLKKILECATCSVQFIGGKASLRRHISVMHLGEPSKQKRPPRNGPRATRKDKGTSKCSLAAKLSSVVVEPDVEKQLVSPQSVGGSSVMTLGSLCEAIETDVIKEIPFVEL